jgi:hypothetical protein
MSPSRFFRAATDAPSCRNRRRSAFLPVLRRGFEAPRWQDRQLVRCAIVPRETESGPSKVWLLQSLIHEIQAPHDEGQSAATKLGIEMQREVDPRPRSRSVRRGERSLRRNGAVPSGPLQNRVGESRTNCRGPVDPAKFADQFDQGGDDRESFPPLVHLVGVARLHCGQRVGGFSPMLHGAAGISRRWVEVRHCRYEAGQFGIGRL